MGADVVATDPHVTAENFRLPVDRVDFTEQELAKCDAALLLCDHAEFDFDLIARTAAYVLDCRRTRSLRASSSSVETAVERLRRLAVIDALGGGG